MHHGVTIAPSQWDSHGAKATASTSIAGLTKLSPSIRRAIARYAAFRCGDGSGSGGWPPAAIGLLAVSVIVDDEEAVLGRGAVGAGPVVGQVRERRAGRDLPDGITFGRVVHVPADLALQAGRRSEGGVAARAW